MLEMDPRSDWALGEFREARIELLLLEHDGAMSGNLVKSGAAAPASVDHAGSSAYRPRSGVASSSSRRIAYQGERLAGLLVVKFDAESPGEWSAPLA